MSDLTRSDLVKLIAVAKNAYHPIEIDLEGVDLGFIDLKEMVTVMGLTKIKLIGVVKNPLNLKGVNLEGVDLSYLDLTGANLECANLRKANLECTDLSKTILDGAFLDGAIVNPGTSFYESTFWSAEGLETLDLSQLDGLPDKDKIY